MKLVLEVSAKEFDAVVKKHRHVGCLNSLEIRQEDGVLATELPVLWVAELGQYAPESKERRDGPGPVIVVQTGGGEET